MKKTALLALFVLALGGARLESASEPAGEGGRLQPNPERMFVRYTATYEHDVGGSWNCVGTRISNRAFTSDVEQCTFSDLSTLPPGTYDGSPNYIVLGRFYSWFSDYDGAQANRVRLIITDNGDGTGHADIEAYY